MSYNNFFIFIFLKMVHQETYRFYLVFYLDCFIWFCAPHWNKGIDILKQDLEKSIRIIWECWMYDIQGAFEIIGFVNCKRSRWSHCCNQLLHGRMHVVRLYLEMCSDRRPQSQVENKENCERILGKEFPLSGWVKFQFCAYIYSQSPSLSMFVTWPGLLVSARM